ncbi:uracil-DNA glycosylase [Aeromonas mytilicola subsp. aquatica]|uniref:uracil-DNA glycosylase n=1 Tax=Aeromonas mytilicola TaxID=3377113 RepID=UPI0037C14154
METWSEALGPEKNKSYFRELREWVKLERRSGKTIYPQESDVFNSFALTELNAVKVVILGQDPYINPNEAHGLSFSVPHGVKIPPSLANIYQELADDIPGFQQPTHGNLESWAQQGVLLLNTALTVEAGISDSHKGYGWEIFTDKAISAVNEHCRGVVFLLWGAKAKQKKYFIDDTRHHILTAPHPSPYSASNGFFGCKHFSQTNTFLISQGKRSIDWTSVCH